MVTELDRNISARNMSQRFSYLTGTHETTAWSYIEVLDLDVLYVIPINLSSTMQL